MPLSFANDISVLFGQGDVICMNPKGVKLKNYAYMSDPAGDETFPSHANANHVIARLKGLETPQMPLNGPYWTQAKIDVLEHWLNEGCSP
jgi:hypothetical protein